MVSEIIIYTISTAVSIAGFYLIYHVFFSKGHHFQFSRMFILLALSFSFVFPFIQFDLANTTLESVNNFKLDEYFPPYQEIIPSTFFENKKADPFMPLAIPLVVYCFGVIIFAFRYAIKLRSIQKIILENELIKKDNYFYVKLKEGQPTFSFRDYIFTGQKSMTDENKAMFIHEQCHVDQKHTLDLLFVELLLIVQWFNPFIYLFKRRLVEIHEFLADDRVLKSGHDKIDYLKLLYTSASKNPAYNFTSQFGSNLKNRIIMMNRNKTIRLKVWKTVFPFLFAATIIVFHSGFSGQSTGIPLIHIAKGTSLNHSINTILGDINSDPVFHHPIKKDDLIRLAAGFGMRMHPVLKKEMMHNGIDYVADPGVKIYASAGGTVREAGSKGAYGKMVIIDHDAGFSSRYAHMATIKVQAGDLISANQIIGAVGNTGLSIAPHLHFEIMKEGEYVDPMNYLEEGVPVMPDPGTLD